MLENPYQFWSDISKLTNKFDPFDDYDKVKAGFIEKRNTMQENQ